MRKLHLLTLLIIFNFSLSAQMTDLSRATIIAAKKIPSPVRETAIRVLKEEIALRSSIQLKESEKFGNQPVLALVLSSEKELAGITIPVNNSDLKPENKPEGYRLVLDQSNGKNIGKMATEKEKLARLEVIAKWENPGSGSYYDNISDISKSSHVLTFSDDATDVAWWEGGLSRRRLSTQLFQNFPVLNYNDLDPNGRYLIRIAGYREALLRVDGERIEPTIYNKGYEEFKEFPLNPKFFSDGKIDVTFDQPEESTLNWRERSKVTDVWLIKLN